MSARLSPQLSKIAQFISAYDFFCYENANYLLKKIHFYEITNNTREVSQLKLKLTELENDLSKFIKANTTASYGSRTQEITDPDIPNNFFVDGSDFLSALEKLASIEVNFSHA